MPHNNIDELKQLLIEYSGGFVHLCLPGGNFGDELIYIGLRKLLAEYDIKYSEFKLGRRMSGETLFVAGCGGYCRFWHDGIAGVKLYLDSFQRIVILPSTFEATYNPTRRFLENLPQNCLVFCRERLSYEFACEILNSRARLSRDTAFYIPWDNYKSNGSGVLHAFRRDRESSGRMAIPEDNIDVSLEAKDCQDMLKTISAYQEVHTDRAHVAISAAMLNKKTIMYDCGYYKLKAIYDYSLSDLPNTSFVKGDIQSSSRWDVFLNKFKSNSSVFAKKLIL